VSGSGARGRGVGGVGGVGGGRAAPPARRRAWRLALAMLSAAGAATPGPGATAPAAAPAGAWVEAAFGASARAPSAGREVRVADLLALRDIAGLSLSPDGRWAAFSVRQAVADENRYVMRWFVVRTDGAGGPVALPLDGGQPIAALSYGLPQSAIPSEPARWSPDSRRLAVRRKVGDRVELWVWAVGDRAARQVPDGGVNVMDFGWTAPARLAFRTGLDPAAFRAGVRAEAKTGWLLDERIPLMAARRPEPTPPDCARTPAAAGCRVASYVAEIGGRVQARPATEEEAAPASRRPATQLAALRPEPTVRMRTPGGPGGTTAWLETVDPARDRGFRPVVRVATDAPAAAPCADPACVGGYIFALGWARGGRSVWFLKGEGEPGRIDGAPRDRQALYEWDLAGGRVRRVRLGDDVLDDCQVRDATAYCLREAATEPRHLVAIALDTGEMRRLADPNPLWQAKAFPPVRRMPLTDSEGNPGVGHLVLPYGYVPGRAYPLVVVQYRSRGFLRGGVGDEYPIFPLAAEGYAVLSVDKPEEWTAVAELPQAEYERRSMADDLRDRRRIAAAIDRAVDELIAQGIADRDRLALTGLSAGAEVVHYMLQRSGRFRAAIASSGAHDRTFLALLPTREAQTRLMDMFGADQLVAPEASPLGQLSWSARPERLTTPLLINVGSDELMLGFEGLKVLRRAGRPLEVRVFPDEFHIKYQPQTYAGIYRNNLLWLRYWLKDERSPEGEAAEYARWDAMRQALGR